MEPRDPHSVEENNEDDDDISTIPFAQQKPFGRGLWKHPISFVAATPESTASQQPAPAKPSLADAYLAIVLPNGAPSPEPKYKICSSCKEPIKEASSREHYLTLAHQLSLPRTPTPSAIDRSRMGLKYMERHGFDIDARRGLGLAGEGRLYPILPKEKFDKLGVGRDNVEADGSARQQKPREVLLDAGKIRKKAAEEKAKAAKLRNMFYGNDKVSEYLGELEGQEQAMNASKLRLGSFKGKGGKRKS